MLAKLPGMARDFWSLSPKQEWRSRAISVRNGKRKKKRADHNRKLQCLALRKEKKIEQEKEAARARRGTKWKRTQNACEEDNYWKRGIFTKSVYHYIYIYFLTKTG